MVVIKTSALGAEVGYSGGVLPSKSPIAVLHFVVTVDRGRNPMTDKAKPKVEAETRTYKPKDIGYPTNKHQHDTLMRKHGTLNAVLSQGDVDRIQAARDRRASKPHKSW